MLDVGRIVYFLFFHFYFLILPLSFLKNATYRLQSWALAKLPILLAIALTPQLFLNGYVDACAASM